MFGMLYRINSEENILLTTVPVDVVPKRNSSTSNKTLKSIMRDHTISMKTPSYQLLSVAILI